MASIRREILLGVPAAVVWAALADVGALHTRLVSGFVTDCRLEGNARIVKFANGLVAKELIVDVDSAQQRMAWTAVGGRLTHHNASAQVFEEGPGGCRVVWIADLLHDNMAPAIAGMIEQGITATKATLERHGAAK